MKSIMGCLFSAILGGLVVVWLTDPHLGSELNAQNRDGRRGPTFSITPGKDQPDNAEPSQIFNQQGLSDEEAIRMAVYENTNKGVVNITTKGSRIDGLFFLELPSEGTGSGAVIDKSGHILTNLHVIENAREVAVTLFNGKTYDASFVGADPVNDIAVLKVDAPRELLHPIPLGDSGKLNVGMNVFAIGNPFGLERTMTTGIISSLNRSLQLRGERTIKSIIQIDAAINPGNSGGPLLNSHGRIIGINTAIASNTGQNSGVGFAIPVNLVKRVVPQLIKHGRVIRPNIGIQRVYETENGLLIARLEPGGPAEKAGLRGPKVTRDRHGPFILERVDRSAADLIVAVDGQPVETADDFLGYIESKEVGRRVVLTVIRNDRQQKVPVTLGGDKELQEKPEGFRGRREKNI